MHFSMNRGCGPRGRGDRWEQFAARAANFAADWTDAQRSGGRGEGRSEGRGRGRRMFDGGELRLVMLRLIADSPRHGYDLIREIEALTGGAYAPSPGVVYPTLTLLDDMGLIEEQQSEGAKKRFAATDAGRAHLEENCEQVEALVARLKALGQRHEAWDETPVRRAFGNLRMVIGGVRLGGYPAEKLHEIAALLDEVAQKIERLR